MKVHTWKKPYKCTYCDYQSYQKEKVDAHVLVHTGEKPFGCDLCDYRCTQKSNLKRHIRKHTGEKPCKCKFCEHRSGSSSDLKKHLFVHENKKDMKEEEHKVDVGSDFYVQNHNLKVEEEFVEVKNEYCYVKEEKL